MADTDEIRERTEAAYPDDWSDADTRAVNTARILAADAVQKVGNGHPGTAMSLAPLAYTLYQRVMRHDPVDTTWVGRDRFVLSCGHSSLTQYIQLYLGGFGLELADLEALRTWDSLTPGHPEFRHTKGVEITTGPLGQGLASAVGMSMASRYERGLFDPDAAPGASPFDHFIYVIASDGDIEEGVTSEASSLAGTQELGNLIVFYDQNQISIEDDTTIALGENTPLRYEAYGWHVQTVESGEDVVAIEAAIEAAKKVGKLTPAMEGWGRQLAARDLEAFEVFAASAPVVSAVPSAMAKVAAMPAQAGGGAQLVAVLRGLAVLPVDLPVQAVGQRPVQRVQLLRQGHAFARLVVGAAQVQRGGPGRGAVAARGEHVGVGVVAVALHRQAQAAIRAAQVILKRLHQAIAPARGAQPGETPPGHIATPGAQLGQHGVEQARPESGGQGQDFQGFGIHAWQCDA